ncbi:MAG: FAD-dependent oxidoreductase [Anaerolineae bacterium]
MAEETKDVLIIGAGLAGIMAARVLQAQGVSVTVFDKSRSVGGRMATRRVGPGVADHGAQFFTVRTPEFQAMVDEWIREKIVFVWSHGFSDGSLQPLSFDGHPRHAVYGGMNALVKHLAAGVEDVRLDQQIFTATCDENGWILQNQNGELFLGRALLMTPPVPQALKILEEGATILTEKDDAVLRPIEYVPSLTAMFLVEGRVTLPPPGVVQRRDTSSHIAWISDNQQKGISPEATVITLQANDTFSAQMWPASDDRILNSFRTSLQIYMADNAVVKQAELKRWRFSRPTTTVDTRAYVADNHPPLVFGGDAFGGPRVEGAVLSGIAAGEVMLEKIRALT